MSCSNVLTEVEKLVQEYQEKLPPPNEEIRIYTPMELFEARQNFPAKEEYKKLYNFIAQLDQESRNKLTAFMYYGRDGGEWKDCLTHAEKCLNWNSQAAASMIADKVHLLRYFENARKLLIKENIDINSL